MMGTKERSFAPLINVSLEELVPIDHFYRHLERALNLSFVREFVHETYAGGGRPSIDPVVFLPFFLPLWQFYFPCLIAAIKRNIGRRVSSRISGCLSSIACVG
jgi:hypothetical protein